MVFPQNLALLVRELSFILRRDLMGPRASLFSPPDYSSVCSPIHLLNWLSPNPPLLPSYQVSAGIFLCPPSDCSVQSPPHSRATPWKICFFFSLCKLLGPPAFLGRYQQETLSHGSFSTEITGKWMKAPHLNQCDLRLCPFLGRSFFLFNSFGRIFTRNCPFFLIKSPNALPRNGFLGGRGNPEFLFGFGANRMRYFFLPSPCR